MSADQRYARVGQSPLPISPSAPAADIHAVYENARRSYGDGDRRTEELRVMYLSALERDRILYGPGGPPLTPTPATGPSPFGPPVVDSIPPIETPTPSGPGTTPPPTGGVTPLPTTPPAGGLPDWARPPTTGPAAQTRPGLLVQLGTLAAVTAPFWLAVLLVRRRAL